MANVMQDEKTNRVRGNVECSMSLNGFHALMSVSEARSGVAALHASHVNSDIHASILHCGADNEIVVVAM